MRDQKLIFPHVGPVHAFVHGFQSEEATGALLMINPHTQCMSTSVGIRFRRVYGLVGWLEAARSPHANNKDSSAGVYRLKTLVASPDRRRPAGTQVSIRTLSATLTSIADL